MFGYIPMKIKYMSGVIHSIQKFKKIAGGFDFRDLTCSGVDFALRFIQTF